MIQRNDYLKDVYSMTTEEKLALRQRLADAEADGEVTLDEMLTILSAFPRAHGFISVAYQLDKARCQREIDGFTKLLKDSLPALPLGREPQSDKELTDHSPSVGSTPKQKTSADGASKHNASKKEDKSASSSKTAPSLEGGRGESLRPLHFDSWFSSMSPALQEKIQSLKDLHTKKLHYRQMVEQLSADPNHSKQELSRVATLCVNYEKKIQAIYDQSQIEWDELQGRTVSDETKKMAEQDEIDADKKIKAPLQLPRGGESLDTERISNTQQPKVTKTSSHRGGREVGASQQTNVTSSPISSEMPAGQRGASTMTEEELSALTVAQIKASDLPEGPQTYFINKRVENARQYLKKWIPEHPTKEQKAKAIGYANDILDAGKSLSPKIKEQLEKRGIEVPDQEK